MGSEAVTGLLMAMVMAAASGARAEGAAPAGENGAVEARVRALLGDDYSRDIRIEIHVSRSP